MSRPPAGGAAGRASGGGTSRARPPLAEELGPLQNPAPLPEPAPSDHHEDAARSGLDPAVESAVMPDTPHVTPTPAPLSRNTAAIVSATAALAFAALAIWIAWRGSLVPAMDQGIHHWVMGHRGPASITAARVIRWGGVSWAVLPALIAVGAVTAGTGSSLRRRAGAGLLLCLIASAGDYAEVLVNRLIARPRPPVADWAGPASGWSFPSGHTTAATLAALAAAWALTARLPPGWPRRAAWAGAAFWAAAVGWTRLWLGVHWPTDVAAAWLFGLAWIFAAVAVTLTVRRPAQDAPAPGSTAGSSARARTPLPKTGAP